MLLKKVFKFFKILIPVLLLVVILLMVVAKLTEDEITDVAIKQISESIETPISIGKATFTLIRKFPFATIKLEGVQMSSSDSSNFADTLVNFETVFVSVKSKPLLKKNLEIVEVELEGVEFNYLVDSKGSSNFDFLLQGGDSTKEDSTKGLPLGVNLEQLLLKQVRFNYVDSSIGARGKIHIPELELNGVIDTDLLVANVEGEIQLSDCDYQNTTLHQLSVVEIKIDAGIQNDSIRINKLQIIADEGKLNAEGLVIGSDTSFVDLHITGQNLRLAEFKKYIPDSFVKKIDLRTIGGDLFFNGNIKGDVLPGKQPHIAAELQIHDGKVQIDTFPLVEDLYVTLQYNNGKYRNNKSTRVICPQLQFTALESTGDLTFTLRNLDRIKYSAKLKSTFNLEEFAPYVPDSILKDFKGTALLETETRGEIPDTFTLAFFDEMIKNSTMTLQLQKVNIRVDTSLSIDSINATINYLPKRMVIENMTAYNDKYKIRLSDGQIDAEMLGSLSGESGIDLKNLELHTGQSVVKSRLVIPSVDSMDYSLDLVTDISLADFNQFLPDSLISSLTGKLNTNIQASGQIDRDSSGVKMVKLIRDRIEADISMQNLVVKSPNPMINLTVSESNINYQADSLNIYKLAGNFHHTKYSLDSVGVSNIFNKFIKKDSIDLLVFGDFNFGKIDYSAINELIAANKAYTATGNESKKELEASQDSVSQQALGFLVRGRFSAEEFKYNNATFRNIKGLMRASDSLYIIDKLKMTAFGGGMKNSIKYKINEKGQQEVYIKNRIAGMDIKRVLRDMDHFGQNEIHEDNLSGTLSMAFDSRIVLEGDSLISNLIRSQGDIRLENGGIYNYAPVVELEKYLPIKGLENLQFKTLNSSVFIFKDAIYVPQTLIVTNKFDASVFGIKSFGEDYSYHAEVFILDLLTGKSKRQNKKQDAQGEDITELDRKGRRIRSWSENGKRKNGFDTDENRNATNRKIKNSKNLLSLLFDPRITSYETGVEEK